MLNAETEKLPTIDGFTCTECNDRGGKYIVSGNEVCWQYCKKCENIRTGIHAFKLAGLANKTFDNYIANQPWQKTLLVRLKQYTELEKKWLFLGGQSGSGKTHLCTAAAREIIIKGNTSAILFKWIENNRKLKILVNDADYISEINKYKDTDVLYIDDMFKGDVTAADLKIAFEIIDYRYCHNLRTIISSEKYIEEITNIDEAIGGRIKEMSSGYSFAIPRDKSKNYRNRGNGGDIF